MLENLITQSKKPINHPTIICCDNSPLLVNARGGGRFVEGKCTICGKVYSLSNNDFIESFQNLIKCRKCGAKMNPIIFSDKLLRKSYAFTCKECNFEVFINDLLSHVDEMNNVPFTQDKNDKKLVNSLDLSLAIKTNNDNDRLVHLTETPKQYHPPKAFIALCINCLKRGDISCPGPDSTTGSYDRQSYGCKDFRPDYIKERY